MVATLSYGIGQKISVPVSKDALAHLSEQSVKEAIEALLAGAGVQSDGTIDAIRETVQDARAVIEVRKGGRFEPVSPQSPFKATVFNTRALELQINRPHAGG